MLVKREMQYLYGAHNLPWFRSVVPAINQKPSAVTTKRYWRIRLQFVTPCGIIAVHRLMRMIAIDAFLVTQLMTWLCVERRLLTFANDASGRA